MVKNEDEVSLSTIDNENSFTNFKNKKIEGYLNLVGDFLHNITDGLILGILFASKNKKNVISTTLAIVAHEIP